MYVIAGQARNDDMLELRALGDIMNLKINLRKWSFIMVKKANSNYENLLSAIKAGEIGNFYIFHGEERYLLDHNIKQIRSLICPEGLDSFNYKRFEGNTLSLSELENAVNTFPAFAERTLIEIHDFDIFDTNAKEQICEIVSDLPPYVCLLFIYTTLTFKPDGRQKIHKEIIKYAEVVEFLIQENEKLVKWIRRHFFDAGKNIDIRNAEYLSFITGGLMSNLKSEIEKVAAYCKSDTVNKSDIDALVAPVLDAVTFKLTDAIASGNGKTSMHILAELLQMREAPHKIIYSISLKLRQLLAARVCIEGNLSRNHLMEIGGIRHDFQARTLWGVAQRSSLGKCKKLVSLCSKMALELNNTSEPDARIIELVTQLATI